MICFVCLSSKLQKTGFYIKVFKGFSFIEIILFFFMTTEYLLHNFVYLFHVFYALLIMDIVILVDNIIKHIFLKYKRGYSVYSSVSFAIRNSLGERIITEAY